MEHAPNVGEYICPARYCKIMSHCLSKRLPVMTLVGIVAVFASPLWAQNKAPNVKLSLFASAESIAPGTPFELGLKFELPDGFHIYWENPGDSGAAPIVEWAMPDGFHAGPLRFPAPKLHDVGGVTTNILEGTPILLVTMTPPDDLPTNDTVTIRGAVRWLACKKACFPGTGNIEISLPTAAEAKPAADDAGGLELKVAQRAMPLPPGQAKLLAIDAAVSKSTVAQGDNFDLLLHVKLAKGYHAQSNKPTQKFFVPTGVFLRKTAGLAFMNPAWPKAHLRTDKYLGSVSEFVDDFTVRVPISVTGPTASANISISGILRYQLCKDGGQCYPPEALEWQVELDSETVGAAVENTSPPPASHQAESPQGQTPPAPKSLAQAEPVPGEAGAQDDGLVGRWGLLGAIIAGLLGGLILNIMPCVLPVISIKVLSFVQQGDEDPKRVFRLGLAFSAGIIVSFWILAAGIIALSAGGQQRGWGAFFQESPFLIGMSSLMFVFALSLFGVFEISLPGSTSTKLAGAAEREGVTGAFMKGVLATLLATPCTAPLLGPAIAFALTSSGLIVAIVFTSVGLGMSLPYLILTAHPAWMRYLPKPGAWMVAFKQLMGFLLMATVVWLLWTLAGLMSSDELVWVVCFLSFLAFAAWIYGRITPAWSLGKKGLGLLAAVFTVAFGFWLCFSIEFADINWVKYHKGYAQELSANGYTVYVDYTARWCLTCQTNKAVVLNTESMRARFARDNVVAIKADYTNYDPVIGEDLRAFGRDAVPLNVIYPANRPNEPIVLPVILTKGIVGDALREAGPSTNLDPLQQ